MNQRQKQRYTKLICTVQKLTKGIGVLANCVLHFFLVRKLNTILFYRRKFCSKVILLLCNICYNKTNYTFFFCTGEPSSGLIEQNK